MKLVAYSLLPVNPMPYMHLGYTSATTGGGGYRKDSMLVTGSTGIIMLLIGVMVAIRFRKSQWLAFAGVVVLAGVGLLGAWSAGSYLYKERGPVRHIFPEHVTEERLINMKHSLDAYVKNESLPINTQTVISVLGIKPEERNDGWFHQIRYIRGDEKDTYRYELISAGKDGRFETSDDYTLTVDRSDRASEQNYQISFPSR